MKYIYIVNWNNCGADIYNEYYDVLQFVKRLFEIKNDFNGNIKEFGVKTDCYV